MRCLFVVAYFLILPAWASSALCAKPLSLVSNTNWYPYIYRDSDGYVRGIDADLLRAMLHKLNCQLTIVQLPERRSLYELKNGHFDIGIGASKNSERQQHFYFSIPYREEINRFAYHSNDKELSAVSSVSELLQSDKTIAINLAGWYGAQLDAAKRNKKQFIYSDTVAKRLKMLKYNRVDLVIDDQQVLCEHLLLMQDANIVLHPLIIYQTEIHFIFNKKSVSKRLVDKLNQEISALHSSGELKRYFNTGSINFCKQ